jgi:hypothetical protein
VHSEGGMFRTYLEPNSCLPRSYLVHQGISPLPSSSRNNYRCSYISSKDSIYKDDFRGGSRSCRTMDVSGRGSHSHVETVTSPLTSHAPLAATIYCWYC